MPETTPVGGSVAQTPDQAAQEIARRDVRITAVAWMVGIVGVVAVFTMEKDTSLGAGIGYVAIAAMVAVTAVAIVRAK